MLSELTYEAVISSSSVLERRACLENFWRKVFKLKDSLNMYDIHDKSLVHSRKSKWYYPLPDESLINPEKKMRSCTDYQQENFDELKKTIHYYYHIPRLLDNEFEVFLYSRHHCALKAMRVIKNYFLVRAKVPHLFLNRDPFNASELAFNTVSIVTLEGKKPPGDIIILVKLIEENPTIVNFSAVVKYFFMILDICIYEKPFQTRYKFIFDMANITNEHCKLINRADLYTLIKYCDIGVPSQCIYIYFVNSDGHLQNRSVIKLIRDVLGVCGRTETRIVPHFCRLFNDCFPIEYMPNELGGQAGALMELHKRQISKVQSYADWFAKLDSRFTIPEDLKFFYEINS